MNVFERAQQDEAAGDLAGARRRLMSRAAQSPYSAELCEQIARLTLRMGDVSEAGRWYAATASADADAPRAITAFLKRCAGRDEQIYSQLPIAAVMTGASGLPQAVRERFPDWDKARMQHAGYRIRRRLPPGEIPKPWWTWKERAIQAGCTAGLVVVAVCALVGVWTLARLAVTIFLG